MKAVIKDEAPHEINIQEKMLVELVQGDQEKTSGLREYLRNMMLVMDFDTKCRGRLISQVELNQYTHWLAMAVTEALHYFIGHDCFTPHDEARDLAVPPRISPICCGTPTMICGSVTSTSRGEVLKPITSSRRMCPALPIACG